MIGLNLWDLACDLHTATSILDNSSAFFFFTFRVREFYYVPHSLRSFEYNSWPFKKKTQPEHTMNGILYKSSISATY